MNLSEQMRRRFVEDAREVSRLADGQRVRITGASGELLLALESFRAGRGCPDQGSHKRPCAPNGAGMTGGPDKRGPVL